MSTFQQLPWELRRNILRYVVVDEVVKVEITTLPVYKGEHYLHSEVMARMIDHHIDDFYAEKATPPTDPDQKIGQKLVKLRFIYSDSLKALVRNQEARSEMRQLVYRHATLDMRWIGSSIMKPYYEFLRARLCHFQKVQLSFPLPYIRLAAGLFDCVEELTISDSSAWSDINLCREESVFIRLLRAVTTFFPLITGSIVRVAIWKNGTERADQLHPPLEIEANAELDRKAMAWVRERRILQEG